MEERQRLEELALRVLPPLYRKVRAAAAAEVAAQLARGELAPGELAHSALLRMPHLLAELQAQSADLDRGLAELLDRHAAARTDREREQVLIAYLEQTVPGRAELRRDVDALRRRWMGVDAVRERVERWRAQALVRQEIALRITQGLVTELGDAAAASLAQRSAPLATVLLDLAMRSPRPPNRLAALEAYRVLVARCPAAGGAVPDAEAMLTSLVDGESASPFLQAEALRALFTRDREAGLTLIRYRLRTPQPSPKDFLFRREALFAAASGLGFDALLPILEEAARSDRSEWVRMGACELLAADPGGFPELRRLAGLDGGSEPSAKVRAAAAVSAGEAAARGTAVSAPARQLVAQLLVHEREPLVLRIACDLVGRVCEATPRAELDAFAPPVLDALAELRRRPQAPGAVLESAAAAEQRVRRAMDPVRGAWTRHLAAVARELPVGGRRKLRVDPPPGELPALPEDGVWLGAVLADLAADGFGLYATRRGGVLTLWRGDQFRQRLWRVWHELRHPAPNKRQGFSHTIGRRVPGELRAHPARLDEITATVVPGERVHVASEGGWARHLPTVDDLVDLPVRSAEPVRIFSSHGVTVLRPPSSLAQRLKNRLRLTSGYARLADLRQASLAGSEPRERRRYVEQVRRELGVEVRFEPYQKNEPPPPRVAELFSPAGSPPSGVTLHAGVGTAITAWLAASSDRLFEADSYLFGLDGNGIAGLAIFTALLFSYFLVNAYRKRAEVRQARGRIPLSVGGWGTRGKSGTERLKAALFGGLGFDVFAKTTGSEAMFVHTAPGGAPSEFFIFRPYDKATIWEQKDMLRLGARLGSEVFLWECMALQPAFVRLLQNDWMKDDLATLTNAYPDHEDIQGPAGLNVAETIAEFIPEGGKVLTTEDHFLPLFEEQARRRGATLVHSPSWEAELIPEELLALFPYREHPRNMALVARMAEELGVPRARALALMADHVQPEIGVLKVFPEAKVRGRRLTFINGHSANERTGFMNNWVRTGLDAVDCARDPDRAVITVINNRWDRVSRSEVFARIMVEDAAADRHVLIGTNLVGLRQYVRDALGAYLARLDLVAPEDLVAGAAGAERSLARLAKVMARLKIPVPAADTFFARLAIYARGAHRLFVPVATLRDEVNAALASAEEAAPEVDELRARLDERLGGLIESSLAPDPAAVADGAPELLEPATVAEVREHALFLLARMAVHARLRRELPKGAEARAAADRIAEFKQRFDAAYVELFLEQLVPVWDPAATGDQVVAACAAAVPPGVRVSIMGSQNIKGTGLDWVYRWIALDKVGGALRALEAGGPEERRRALERLEAFDDHGFMDTALAAKTLPALAAHAGFDLAEAARLRRLAERAAERHEHKRAALGGGRPMGRYERVVRWLEKTFDYLDSVRRRNLSEQLIEDLVAGRVSHARAAVETRRLYERQKGGWLLARLDRLLRRGEGPPATAPEPARLEPVLPVAPNTVVSGELGEQPVAVPTRRRGDNEVKPNALHPDDAGDGREQP